MQQTQRATVKVHSFAVFRFQLKKRTTDVAGQNQSKCQKLMQIPPAMDFDTIAT